MIDSEKRAVASKLIQNFFSGRITNFEYDDQFPNSDSDPALRAIYTMLWFSYSDVREHRFDPQTFTTEGKELLDQIQLFLCSSCEYVGQRSFVDWAAIPKRFWYWITRQPRPDVQDCWPFDTDIQLRNAWLTQRSEG